MAGRTDIRSLLQDFLGANPEEDVERLRAAQAQTREQVGKERFSQQMGSAMDALGAGLTRSPVPRARPLTEQPTATQELDAQSRLTQQQTRQRLDAAGALDSVEQRAAKAQLDAQARAQTSAAQEEMRQSMRAALKKDGLDDASIEAMVKNPKMYETWARGQEAQRGRAFTAGENAKGRANARAIAEQRGQERAAASEGKAAAGASRDSDGLRREFERAPEVKAYRESSIAHQKMQSAASDPSAAGDLSLIFSFMKVLDPGSTVREGEFANAQNAAGVDERIISQYNRVKSGERLSQAQRQDFIRQAQSLHQAHSTAYRSASQQYADLAQRRGLNPVDVVRDAPAVSRPQATPGSFSVEGGDGRVTVRDPQTGETFRLPVDRVDEAISDGMERVQ